MARIVIAGGTGDLGTLLIPYLKERGDDIIILSRKRMIKHHPGVDFVLWDGRQEEEWKSCLEGADILLNLCGLSINRRFSSNNKRLMLSSRTEPTALLGRVISTLENPPKLWVNFSGVSIFNGAKTLQDESSNEFGNDFLATLAIKWEEAFLESVTPATRKVIFRMSPVISKYSGILTELLPLAKLGLAGTVGSGRQIMPWIHEQDFCGLICWIIDQENPEPIYHGCSPNPITNKEFMRTLRDCVGVSIGLPLPGLLAKIGSFIKGVDASLILETTPVTTKFVLSHNYRFNFPYLEGAIKNLI